jgi:hypothetical protein
MTARDLSSPARAKADNVGLLAHAGRLAPNGALVWCIYTAFRKGLNLIIKFLSLGVHRDANLESVGIIEYWGLVRSHESGPRSLTVRRCPA